MPRSGFLAIMLGLGVAVSASGARAAVYDLTLSGTITGENLTADSGPAPTVSSLLGRPFSATFAFDDGSGPLNGSGMLTVDISGHPGFLYGPEDPGGSEPKTYSAGHLPALLVNPNGEVSGGVLGIAGLYLGFDYVPGAPTDVLTADFGLASINVADDSGSLHLDLLATSVTANVAPVPLPGALSLLSAALLAVGLLGYSGRKSVGDRSSTFTA